MKKSIFFILIFPLFVHAQNTIILDPNFEQVLIDLGLDKGLVDGVVPTAKISGVKHLNISHSDVSDLTGIQEFSALISLNCIHNNLTNLPISQNLNLENLNCYGNLLTNIDLSNNIALTFLNCGSNYISSLDLSNNVNLEYLTCGFNHLAFLDVSSNSALEVLYCNNNQISSLDLFHLFHLYDVNCAENILTDINVGFNHSLLNLNCSSNLMSNLNVTQNGMLNYLNCSDNFLTSIDLTFNHELEQLNCSSNNIKSLDVHSNTQLRGLNCRDNVLRCLNVKNGNNIQFMYFYAEGNQNLMCVQVDDESYANTNWLNHVDPTTTFNTNCYGPCTVTGLQDVSLDMVAFPNPTSNNITLDLGGYNGPVSVIIYDLSGRLLFSETSRTISLEELSKGPYMLHVKYGKFHQMVKVIKE